MSRNWLTTLFRASLDGVSFFTETTAEGGGRRIKVHEFPGSNKPFPEDLGRRFKPFTVTAYFASDTADRESRALAAVCDAKGPHILVLPMQGQQSVHCEGFTRADAKDRLGFVAFAVNFVEAGASSPLASVGMMAQLVFDAASGLGGAMAALTAAMIVAARPGWVVAGVLGGLEAHVAGLMALTLTQPVDPAQAPALTLALSSFYARLPSLVSGESGVDASVGPALADLAAAFVPALPAQDAVSAFWALADAAEAVASQTNAGPFAISAQAAEAANAALVARLEQANAIQAGTQALVNVVFTNRPAAIQARADMLLRVDAAMALCSGAGDLDLYRAYDDLRETTVGWFAKTIANLAPFVTVQVRASLPATVLAWALYSDPTRAAELVELNKVPHPTFMPERFEALAS